MSTPLHRHLLDDHHRERRELDGIPLGAVHRLEHLEDELGLIELDHSHRHATARRRARRRPPA